jgi:hypothetical protein
MSQQDKKIKNNNKKIFDYEVTNHIPDSADSIYSPEFEDRLGGQVFVSEDKIRDIVNEELEKRFDPL